jgi:hypothetical protein
MGFPSPRTQTNVERVILNIQIYKGLYQQILVFHIEIIYLSFRLFLCITERSRILF